MNLKREFVHRVQRFVVNWPVTARPCSKPSPRGDSRGVPGGRARRDNQFWMVSEHGEHLITSTTSVQQPHAADGENRLTCYPTMTEAGCAAYPG